MVFRIVQNDTSPTLTSRLSDSTGPVDLTRASDVEFHMMDKFERVVASDNITGRVNYVDKSSGEVEYVFSASDTATVGTYKAEWQVTYNNGGIETFPTDGYVTIEITEEVK